MIPLGLIVVVFTISNRGLASIDLWPLPISFQTPLFSIAMAGVFSGFLFGAVVAWVSAGRTRSRNRQLMRRLENSVRDQAYLKEQLKKADAAAAAAAAKNLALPGSKADAA